MTHFHRKRKPMREVDMIPMVNIILMLLFFFIIAGTVKESEEIHVDIPNAKTSDMAKGLPITLALTRGGHLSFDGIQTSEGTLPIMLREALEKNPNILITIRADERLPAHSLTKLIAIVQKAGGNNLALEVEAG
jgi:biopolymer transport protein ExbD